MKAPDMPPTEDPGLVASTPKGSDLELDALEKIAREAARIPTLGEYREPAVRKFDTVALANLSDALTPTAILSLISAARKGQGEWRGIESAPKDGTPFLAYRAKSRRAEVVRWVAPYEKAGVAFGGEFVKAASGWQLDVIWELHTHWTPLPPPSKQEE